MEILKRYPQKINVRKNTYFASKLVASFIFFLFTMIFSVHESKFNLNGTISRSEDFVNNTITNLGSPAKQHISTRINGQSKSIVKSKYVADNNTTFDNVLFSDPNISILDNIFPELVINDYESESSENSNKKELLLETPNTTKNNNGNINNSNLQTQLMNQQLAFSPNQFENFVVQQQEINLSTSVSYDFVRSGINTFENSSIINYSQSISYSMSNNSRLGIEFGVSEFNYPATKYLKVPGSVENNSSIEVLDPLQDKGFILVAVQVKELDKGYWGTLFFEHSFIKSQDFIIDGRFGFGTTGDGMIAVSRLNARYNLISGIYLSAGAEGRMFNYRLPMTEKKGLAANLSFVWGIYFQF